MIDEDDTFQDIISFLSEIGFLFPARSDRHNVDLDNVYSPKRYMLGWNLYTIEIMQETLLKNLKREDKDDLKPSQFDEDLQIKEETDLENRKAVGKKFPDKCFHGNFKNLLNRATIKQIAFNRDLSITEIHQLAVEMEEEYNGIITLEAALLLVLKQQIQKAPICKGTTNDGKRCKKSTWDDTGLCFIHRQKREKLLRQRRLKREEYKNKLRTFEPQIQNNNIFFTQAPVKKTNYYIKNSKKPNRLKKVRTWQPQICKNLIKKVITFCIYGLFLVMSILIYYIISENNPSMMSFSYLDDYYKFYPGLVPLAYLFLILPILGIHLFIITIYNSLRKFFFS